MEELMRTESVLKGNLCNIFDVLISLCDSDAKNQFESMTKYSDLEKIGFYGPTGTY